APVVRTPSPERTATTERSIARERTPTYHAGEPYQKQQGELYRQLVQPAVVNKPAVVSQPLAASAPAARQISTDEPLHGDNYSFGRVLTVFPPCYALIEYKQGIALLELTVAERWLKQAQLNP
ncbi:DNA mismatch repair protein MutL, partial [Yersinia enterocolitica]|nr:DNA mismatch repair protein MutL [Yersinia enterocolitica]